MTGEELINLAAEIPGWRLLPNGAIRAWIDPVDKYSIVCPVAAAGYLENGTEPWADTISVARDLGVRKSTAWAILEASYPPPHATRAQRRYRKLMEEKLLGN